MIKIRKAGLDDVAGIIRVCSEGYRATYPGLLPYYHIEKIIRNFYHEDRIKDEILNVSQAWNGWFVAVDDGLVVGAGVGGLISQTAAELFALYIDPQRKREGIGSKLLEAITCDQVARGAAVQWVSVIDGNLMAVPFYESNGFRYQGEQPAYGLPENEGFESLRYKRIIPPKGA